MLEIQFLLILIFVALCAIAAQLGHIRRSNEASQKHLAAMQRNYDEQLKR